LSVVVRPKCGYGGRATTPTRSPLDCQVRHDVGLSAWELACHTSPTTVFTGQGLLALSVDDRQRPSQTLASGTQRARCAYCLASSKLGLRERRLLAQAAAVWHHHVVNAVENGLITVRNRRSISCIFSVPPAQPCAAYDPSLVSYRHIVGCHRSPGNSASHVTCSIGECRMSLWSTVVVREPTRGSEGPSSSMRPYHWAGHHIRLPEDQAVGLPAWKATARGLLPRNTSL
jgi:hypothetical protein